MTFPWQAIVDLATLVLLIYLFVVSKKTENFLRTQVTFLLGQVNILEKGQQALKSEADALKAHTERLVAVLTQLSPENLLKWVKATEEIYHRGAEARVKEIQRESAEQLSSVRDKAESKEQEAQNLGKLAEDLLDRYGEAASALIFALYELPGHRRDIMLGLIEHEKMKNYLKKKISELQKELGLSPADRSSEFGMALQQALTRGPGTVNPFSQLHYTDVTPGTATEPKGETRTG